MGQRRKKHSLKAAAVPTVQQALSFVFQIGTHPDGRVLFLLLGQGSAVSPAAGDPAAQYAALLSRRVPAREGTWFHSPGRLTFGTAQKSAKGCSGVRSGGL